jgi:hypothetical protein
MYLGALQFDARVNLGARVANVGDAFEVGRVGAVQPPLGVDIERCRRRRG